MILCKRHDSTITNCASLLSLPHDFNCTKSCCSWGAVNLTSTSSTIIGNCSTNFNVPVRIDYARVPCGIVRYVVTEHNVESTPGLNSLRPEPKNYRKRKRDETAWRFLCYSILTLCFLMSLSVRIFEETPCKILTTSGDLVQLNS